MKNKYIVLSLILVVLFSGTFVSCEATKNANNTQKGAVIGAGSGAIIGGILGNNLGKGGNTALGAVIGGVVGGTVGGLIGNKMDKQAREIETALPGTQVQRVGEGIHLVLGENSVNFEFNKATLTITAKQNLDKLVPVFKEYADTDIKIYGYTDSKGSESYNLDLSTQRAAAVKSYLSGKGLSSGRFAVIGMGEAEPIERNDTDAGRSLNRRVEFAILANDKMIDDAKKEAGK
ncbi:OmpA family protein [Flavobacterium cheniae]|uniref:Outer membrane protein OmpA-like peptidoglycan-associated protein n=1 Tax=Flavobacterium cheniae TaxID=295428 RepID=A0A562KP75_9FLAO|nr:OmpA family protein [Flavobacterium cheniae]TDR23013.1 outer membrane protein OmpA-like peptidoglycan-associated protein [Flavobacterium cheniae]TWH97127.1 outer membrane protein OmpA-like peptidoglycan-associated protein [Flavobacterium cheniae]